MFGSKTVTEHLVRGVLGLAALAGAAVLAPRVWPSLVLLPLGLLALRGCPLCWTIGLAQTVWARARGSAATGCTDGSCALRG